MPGEAVSEDINLLNFCRVLRTRQEIADYLGVKTIFYATSHYVRPLLQNGKLAMTLSETPKSSKGNSIPFKRLPRNMPRKRQFYFVRQKYDKTRSAAVL